ncbi:MAG: hypothetical protein NTV54_13730, partial [Ignavibacteriales bacterium]|nr:hypothetical protein [Ignavibacteriales bacterium]
APQINSTGYLVYPINAMTGTVITGGSKYLGQLKQFLAKTPGVAGLPIESFSLLDSSASAGSVLHDPITYTPAQGELIMRTPADSATRYLLVTAKNGPARYAAELHAYADAGSYLFQADGRTLVLHPGYAGYSASQDLERAKAHNTICPVVQGAVNDDAPNRDNASPPAADASITKSTYNTNFSYAAVDMELYGSKPLSTFDEGLKLIAAAGNLPYDYGNSLHMTWKNNGEKFGSCGRKFLMVNNSYLIVRDDVTQANTGMQYAVSSIHGNNGNNITAAAALASGITTSANGESIWAAGSTGPVLRVNTAALRGKIGAYSNLEASVHQMADPVLHPDSPRAKYYHAALRTACGFTDHYGQMLSILESDPNTTSKTGITTKWNADTDPYLFYTVDGRGKSYGRYDILFSQKQPGRISIAKTGFSFPIETDASFLVVSYGGDVNDTNQIKIFSNGATFIHSGTYTFIPNDSGEAQTSFVIKRDPVPVLSVLPSVYRRDTIAVGDSSVQKFVIKNSSNADLIYQVLSIQTTTFAVSGSPGGALKSLDSAVFSVVFKPRGFAYFEELCPERIFTVSINDHFIARTGLWRCAERQHGEERHCNQECVHQYVANRLNEDGSQAVHGERFCSACSCDAQRLGSIHCLVQARHRSSVF